MHYPRLRYHNDQGLETASDYVLIRLFMKHTHKAVAPAAMRALELFRERIRPHQLDWYIGYDGYTQTLDDTKWEEIRQEMLGPRESFFPRFASGNKRYGVFSMEYRGLKIPSPWPFRKRDTSVLHLCLPTEYLEERGPGNLRALALELAERLPLNSGYVTLAFSGGRGDVPHFVGMRYRGIHLSRGGADFDVDTQVDGVHWLNFLGQPVLGQLGGVASLRERLSSHPGLSLHEMPGERVLIALGEAPSMGDVEAGETLPLHRELARLLEPWLYHHEVPFGDMTPEEQLRWERRFLEE